MTLHEKIDALLAEIDDAGLRRDLLNIETPPGPWIRIDGRSYVNMCGNDYLALAFDPRVVAAAQKAAAQWGAGAGSSRLVTGNPRCLDELEKAVAAFVGTEAALLFGSGYHANTGLIPALAGAGDLILSDELNHASIIDGCRLSKAKRLTYLHLDLDHLETLLKKHREHAGVALVVTESIFSMDGDAPDLRALFSLCEKYDAAPIVDEAHALGVVSAGRGMIAGARLSKRAGAIVGTFGKSFGSFGAFVAGTKKLRELLVNRARSAIFSTALPPPAVGAALEAVRIVTDHGKDLAKKLTINAAAIANIARAAGYEVPRLAGAIIPVIIGSEKDALAASEALFSGGILARAIRPPTVPPDTCRLRLTACSAHGSADLDRLATAFNKMAR